MGFTCMLNYAYLLIFTGTVICMFCYLLCSYLSFLVNGELIDWRLTPTLAQQYFSYILAFVVNEKKIYFHISHYRFNALNKFNVQSTWSLMKTYISKLVRRRVSGITFIRYTSMLQDLLAKKCNSLSEQEFQTAQTGQPRLTTDVYVSKLRYQSNQANYIQYDIVLLFFFAFFSFFYNEYFSFYIYFFFPLLSAELYRRQELLIFGKHMGSPRLLVGSVLLIFLVFCVVLLCSVSCVPNVVSVSGLSILDYPWGLI